MTRDELRENLWVALETLRARKVRSGLTILGIVIGVTSVISVAAIIQGLNGMVSEHVSKFGPHTMFVMRIPAGSNPFQRLPEKIRLRRNLQLDDAKYLLEHCTSLKYATALIGPVFDEVDSEPTFCRTHNQIDFDAKGSEFSHEGIGQWIIGQCRTERWRGCGASLSDRGQRA